MKKLITVLSIFFLASAFTVVENVYICDSKTAQVYHATETCSGLHNCKHEIIKVSKTDAVEKYGRRACKVCYN